MNKADVDRIKKSFRDIEELKRGTSKGPKVFKFPPIVGGGTLESVGWLSFPIKSTTLHTIQTTVCVIDSSIDWRTLSGIYSARASSDLATWYYSGNAFFVGDPATDVYILATIPGISVDFPDSITVYIDHSDGFLKCSVTTSTTTPVSTPAAFYCEVQFQLMNTWKSATGDFSIIA